MRLVFRGRNPGSKSLKSKVQSPRFNGEARGWRLGRRGLVSSLQPLASSPKVSYWRLATTGLTVLELVVALGVAGLFYTVLYSFYSLHAHALRVQEVKLDLQESSRLAIDFLVRELHFAGARPVQGGTCAGFERLTNAESQRITLQYDYRGNSSGSSPDGCPDDPNERVSYVYEPATQLLKRASGGGAPQPFIGDVPVGGFLLRYFDRDGTELGSLLNADQRAAVHRIVVTVRTSKPHPDSRITVPLTSEHTSTVYLPNPAR